MHIFMKSLYRVLLVTAFFVLLGCDWFGDDEVVLEDFALIRSSVEESYELTSFELQTIRFVAFYSDGTSETISLSEDMIGSADHLKLTEVGHHDILVTYKGFEVTVSVQLVASDLYVTLNQIYALGVSEGFIHETYEEWLESIRGQDGSDGEDGRDGVDGRDGLDGRSITDAMINEQGILILTLSDGATIEAGQVVNVDERYIEHVEIDALGELIVHWSDGEIQTLGSVVGQDGLTPHIGANGHWWIGNYDTGITAVGQAITDYATDGLRMILTVFQGVVGYEIISYVGTDEVVHVPNLVNGMPVISIGDNAFGSNTLLREIYLPEELRRIENRAFSGATRLEFVHIPSTSKLTHIHAYAFNNNQALKQFDIPETVTYIGDYAFSGTSLLSSVYLHQTIEYVGYRAFHMSTSQGTAIYVEHERQPEHWSNQWTNKNEFQVHFGVRVSEDYYYNLTEDLQARIVGPSLTVKKV